MQTTPALQSRRCRSRMPCSSTGLSSDIHYQKKSAHGAALRGLPESDAVRNGNGAAPTTMTTTSSKVSPDSCSSGVKTLPKATIPIKLVGEGAANAVFEIRVPSDAPDAAVFQGKLLRMSKVPKRGQDSTYDYLWQQTFFEKSIRPILGDNAVDQELVAVPEATLVDQLNDILESINQTRKFKFRSSYVGQSSWGLLVDDMRPQDPSLYTLVEFKPKWLSQSPNAPADAIRCRQCALELRYFITNPNSDRPLPSQKPCPLAVCEDDPPPEVASPLRMAPKLAKIAQPARDLIAAQLRGITGLPALKELRRQQDLHDPVGPLHANPADPEFALAMTIRDCTCFVQIALGPVETEPRRLHFGDLDWKDPKRKFEHWRGTEEALVDGGFYTADRIRCDAKLYRAPTKCLLEWTSAAKHTGKPRVLEVIQLGDMPDRASANVHVLAQEDMAGLQKQLAPYVIEASSPTELHEGSIRNVPA